MTRAEEIAWAAGLFEGEGSIFIHRDTIRMQLGTCDLDVLERFHEIMGCGRIFGPEDRAPHKPLWRWIVAKQSEIPQASALLEPFLGDRRRNALERAWHNYSTRSEIPGQGVLTGGES